MRSHLPPRVLNKKQHFISSEAVYIGRPSIWGNPFQIGRNGTRADVIAMHRAWLKSQSRLLRRLPDLRGRDLVCFCAPLACHGHTLLWLANPDLRDPFLHPVSTRGFFEGLDELAALADAARG